ncbi:DUF2187 domain-containing protein [Ligilactobacillus equi]|uniref:DUF2187 domain-containing protein n=2 Tax=Ligilactobacillus equi TaxID=137357 RepID=V7HZI9_9LACO|nr:hypothetical protein [Ligilactobacillus equi]ETA74426.1 hypothetical protein LEQ_2099c [Ligilactobacillus equi DPC 6820]KRL78774.1 hypothetical protein FC36_GL000962 [Ligilactobacillus equi DSM 15833 = JCM 10991]MCQ2556874.1 DUF2187 domain-containing protein [Ligilactobacillus sp.]
MEDKEKKAPFEIGDKVKCQSFGSLKNDFEGTIEKNYENSAVVAIEIFADEDAVTVADFHSRAVVSFTKMEKIA